MFRWLKRLGCAVVVLALVLVTLSVFVRYQGVQHLAALRAGHARPLPALETYAAEPAGGTLPCALAPVTVLTYNIFNGSTWAEAMVERFANGDLQGMRPWSERVPELKERVAEYNPDLIGFQEFLTDADVMSIVPNPDAYTLHSYKLGSFEWGDSALLFKHDRFEMLESGQVWLGPTPDLPLAFGFKRLSMLRYVNWAVMREKASGFTFLFVNTHFDNAMANKAPSAPLYRERFAARTATMPVIATGDFNSNATTERYQVFVGADATPPLLQNAHDLAATPRVWTPSGELRAIQAGEDLAPAFRIDHILVGGPCPVTVEDWFIDLRPMRNGEPLSDHDPMVARIRFGS
jgi:endonuclease/exonuclease/phosphatase family metal-dependent hydrolase